MLTDDSAKKIGHPVISDVRLVQEVRKRPALYNPSKRGYKDNTETDKAWLEIANEMGFRALDVRNRWRSLRDKFVREKKRLVLDGEASYRSRDPWPLLDEMSFLWDFINHRKDVYTRKMSAQVRTEYIKRNLQPGLPQHEWGNAVLETPETSPSHIPHSTASNESLDPIANNMGTATIKQDPDERDGFLNEPPNGRLRYLLETTMQQDESSEDTPEFELNSQAVQQDMIQDEDGLFCLSVASTLRRFSHQQKALAKLRIQQMLYDIEFPNHNMPTNSSSIRARNNYDGETVFPRT